MSGEDMRAHLAASPAVAALVGTRITADRSEQDSPRPFIVYLIGDEDRTKTLDGTLIGIRTTIELQCWADTRLAANAVADAATVSIEAIGSHAITSRRTDYDSELDLEATVLTVDWWPD
nr:DUF3168 domain-containing protein [uncultured Albidiferax sp.]